MHEKDTQKYFLAYYIFYKIYSWFVEESDQNSPLLEPSSLQLFPLHFSDKMKLV